MNLKIYDRAVKYIDKMLISRRDDWCVKRLYIRPDVYLKIRVDRVSLQDMETKTYAGWERGTPHDLRISIVNRDDVEYSGSAISWDLHRQYRPQLSRLMERYT